MAKTSRARRYPIPTRRYPPHRPIPEPTRRRPWYSRPSAAVALVILGLIVTLAFVPAAIPGCDPLEFDSAARLQAPTREHPLGTDQFGRDVACRVLHGTRISLPVGIVAVGVAILPGLWLGLMAGYYREWVDAVIGRLTDMMLAFPGILLTLLILAWLGPNLTNAMLAIGLSRIPNYVRLTRSRTLQLGRVWFVRAARIIGSSDARILARHLLPNVLPAVLAVSTLDVAWAILSAATLSFLGLGAQPPTPEWGAMINEGRGFLREAPWISLAPGAAMTLTVLSINLLGDSLRDALDPRSR